MLRGSAMEERLCPARRSYQSWWPLAWWPANSPSHPPTPVRAAAVGTTVGIAVCTTVGAVVGAGQVSASASRLADSAMVMMTRGMGMARLTALTAICGVSGRCGGGTLLLTTAQTKVTHCDARSTPRDRPLAQANDRCRRAYHSGREADAPLSALIGRFSPIGRAGRKGLMII
jgi:hypothetical protein